MITRDASMRLNISTCIEFLFSIKKKALFLIKANFSSYLVLHVFCIMTIAKARVKDDDTIF